MNIYSYLNCLNAHPLEQVQYNSINRGRCGECGDEWSLPRPRPNDEGGKFWSGKIGQTYTEGNVNPNIKLY